MTVAFAEYVDVVDLAFRWADPYHPFAAHSTLRPYLSAAGVPKETMGDPVDRQFWLGDVLDEIKAAAKKRLSPTQYSQLEGVITAQLDGFHRRGLGRRATLPKATARFRGNPSPELRAASIEKYKEFHRYDPIKLEEFPKSFAIPQRAIRAGRGKWVTYRSAKVDPATLKKPKRPVDYIHEFDAGVEIYFPPDAPELDELDVEGDEIGVPRAFYAVEALVKLGDNLGFCIRGEDGNDDAEFEGSGKLPELFCVPDGTCLLIVQDRRDVIAMIWGGALGVFARGIDG